MKKWLVKCTIQNQLKTDSLKIHTEHSVWYIFLWISFCKKKSYLTKHCLTIRDSVVTKTAHPGLILMSESSNIIETMPAWIALWMLNIWWAITDNTYMRSNNKFFWIIFVYPHNWQHYFITCVSILWNSSKHDQAPQDAKPLRNLAKAL